MSFEILHRYTKAVLYKSETATTVRAALEEAVKAGANLTGADLTGANLAYANLTYANLAYANLTYANLTEANLAYANLAYANLAYANLAYANLTEAKEDFYRVLDAAPVEVPALLAALRTGKVDGSTYEGECACLVGTIANARGVNHRSLGVLVPDSSRPAERLFLAIRKGDTPERNPVAKIVEGWIGEWIAAHPIAVPHV